MKLTSLCVFTARLFILLVSTYTCYAQRDTIIRACETPSSLYNITLTDRSSVFVHFNTTPEAKYLFCECFLKPLHHVDFRSKRFVDLPEDDDPFLEQCDNALCRYFKYNRCHSRGTQQCVEHVYNGTSRDIEEAFVKTASRSFNDTLSLEWKYHENYNENLLVIIQILVRHHMSLAVECRSNMTTHTSLTTGLTSSPSSTITTTTTETTTSSQPTVTSTTVTTSVTTTSLSTSTLDTTLTTTRAYTSSTASGSEGGASKQSKGSKDDEEKDSQALVIGVAAGMTILVIAALIVAVFILLKFKHRKDLGARQAPVGSDSSEVRYVSAAEMESHNVHATIDAVGPRPVPGTENPMYDVTLNDRIESIPMEATYATVNRTNRQEDTAPALEQEKAPTPEADHNNATLPNTDQQMGIFRNVDNTAPEFVPEKQNDDYFEDCEQFRRPEVPPRSRDNKTTGTYIEVINMGSASRDMDGVRPESAVSADEIEFEENEIYEKS